MTARAPTATPPIFGWSIRPTVASWLARFGLSAVFPAILLLAWQILPNLGFISTVVLPPFTTVLETLAAMTASGDLVHHLLKSLYRVIQGFSLGAAIGLVLGVAMGVSAKVENLFYPSFRAFCQVPTMAWLPLLMMVFGIDEVLKIIIITKAVMVPMTINAFEGVRGIPEQYFEVARVLRLRRSTRVTRLILPAVIPPVFTGVRQGLSHAWVALVGVEMLASTEGIGYMMNWGRRIFQLDVVLAGVIVVGAIGLCLDIGTRRIERKLAGRDSSSESQLGAIAHRPGRSLGLAFALPLVLLFAWWLSVDQGWADPRLLPPIQKVALAAFDPVVGKLVLDGIGASLWRNLEGAVLGSVAGMLFGALLGFSPIAERMFGPGFHVFRQIAMFAWIPLLTAWFGIGETMRILFISIAAFKPMVMNTQAGIAAVPRQYLEVGRIMCLSRWEMTRHIVLPSALPSLLTGLQLAFIASWLATIGVETLVSFSVGVGAVLREGEEHFHMEVVMFGILLIGCLGFLFNTSLARASKYLLRWRDTRV